MDMSNTQVKWIFKDITGYLEQKTEKAFLNMRLSNQKVTYFKLEWFRYDYYFGEYFDLNKPDDHVLQHDLRWSGEDLVLQWSKNVWPPVQRNAWLDTEILLFIS